MPAVAELGTESTDDSPSSRPHEGSSHGAINESSLISQLFSVIAEKVGLSGGRRESLKEVVEEALEEHEGDTEAINPEERLMLTNILDFGELEAKDIMTPRPDIVAVPLTITLMELKQVISDKEHTRMPVYGRDLDDVKGFIHIKDLVRYLGDGHDFSMQDILRDLMAIPQSVKALDLLKEMRHKRVHMALVVDEYGGTDGIVTLEDLFERIVGDIHDEHDEEDGVTDFTLVSEDLAVADARVEIEVVEEAFGITLVNRDDRNAPNTLGGLVFTLLGRVPKTGEKLEMDGIRFEVIRANRRQIRQLRIIKTD